MRLWSFHPKYLDTKGLVALWREGLLAKKVLESQTKGYRSHPQLERFKKCHRPLNYINAYLHFVCDEALVRGYKFDRTKLERRTATSSLVPVSGGQIEYEWKHLLKKLKARSRVRYLKLKAIKRPIPHPLFNRVPGEIESWEIVG